MISGFLQSHLKENKYDVAKGNDSTSTREFPVINASQNISR